MSSGWADRKVGPIVRTAGLSCSIRSRSRAEGSIGEWHVARELWRATGGVHRISFARRGAYEAGAVALLTDRWRATAVGAFGEVSVLRLPAHQVYLERDGLSMNAKRMHRLWRAAKLQLPKKRPRKRIRGTARNVPETPVASNDVWSTTSRSTNGQQFKCLTVVDDGTAEALAIDVAGSIRSRRVIEVLARLVSERGPPKVLRSDNGPE